MHQLVEALISAFPSLSRIEQMVDFRLNRRLETIALSGNLENTIYRLIQVAEIEGWLPNLVAAAIESNPHNARLRQAADAFDLEPNSQPTLSQAVKAIAPQFETKSVLNPTQFSARLGELEAQVGRIEFASNTRLPISTGFLIGPDMFMTTYHSVANLQQDNIQKGDISMRFDHKVSSDGRSITNGTMYQIATKDWLIDYDEQLDYAILRVIGTPGLDPIGGERAEPDAPARGWITIPVTPPVLSPGTSIIILHYPEGGPLKMSFDTSGITDISADGTHIQYRHNTAPGSAGAPCFNSNWELIAIHQKRNSNGYGEGTTMLALKSPLQMLGIPNIQQIVTPSAESPEDHLSGTSEIYASRQQENTLALLDEQKIYIREAYNAISQAYSNFQGLERIYPEEIEHLVALLETIRKNLFLADELRSPFNSLLPSLAIREQTKRATELSYALSQNLKAFSTSHRTESSHLRYQLLADLRVSLKRLLDQLQDLERLLES